MKVTLPNEAPEVGGASEPEQSAPEHCATAADLDHGFAESPLPVTQEVRSAIAAEIEDALDESGSAGRGSVMDFFWTGLAPFTFLVVFGLTVLLFVLAVFLFDPTSTELAILCAAVLAVGLLVLLPLEYHLVRSRIERPIQRLEHELLGQLPWRPEGDQLLGRLRRTVVEVRNALRTMDTDLRREQERADDLLARLGERTGADTFAARVADSLRQAESVEQFAAEATRLVREAWPADEVVLLHRLELENDLEVLRWECLGEAIDPEKREGGAPRYRKASLPTPVKEAFRRGFYAESGLPFSQDPAFPDARSFVAMSLEHRGVGAGILLAASAELDPPSPESLRRAHPLFSLAFGRAMYVRELGEAEIRDTLTGVFTYDHFLTMVRHEVARSNRYSRPAACVMVDVDSLRRVNETHGSAAGDQIIAEVSQLVRGLIRSTDSLARIIGGRLALLLPETNEEAALVVAERVRARVEEYPFIILRNQVERMTVSLGVSIHPPFGVTALSLVDAALSALTEAKEQGRNRVVVFREQAPAT